MDAGRPARLVVVEDDVIVRTLLTKRLQGAGHVVEAAGDGRDGLDVVRRLQPDLVLTDWMMPEMDGPALIRTLRADAMLRRTYIILLTSKDERPDRVSGLEMGADDYLVKPWADDELLAHVRSGLRIQALQRELAVVERKGALLTMAATLGHEINNPLTVLAATLLMARQNPPEGGALTEFLERCQRQTDRIAKVVQSLEQLTEPLETNYLGPHSMLELSHDGGKGVPRPS